MYTIQLNLDTKMVEILEDGYVKFEIPQADYANFWDKVDVGYRFPGAMRKVRNGFPAGVLGGLIGPAFK